MNENIEDEERLHLESLGTVEFNYALILESLLAQVLKRGGHRIVEEQHKGFEEKGYRIENRHLKEEKADILLWIQWYKKFKDKYGQSEQSYESKLKRLEYLNRFDRGPVDVHNLIWISFILDDIYYYVSFNNNPFFDFYFDKKETNKNDRVKNSTSVNKLDKNLFTHGFYSYEMDYTQSAANILDFLLEATATPYYQGRESEYIVPAGIQFTLIKEDF